MSGPSGLPKFGGLGVEAWVSVQFSTKTELTPQNVRHRKMFASFYLHSDQAAMRVALFRHNRIARSR